MLRESARYTLSMLTRHTRKGITWIDMESPTRQELQEVMNEFSIDARIEEEIIAPTPYPLVVSSARYLYLILHFPTTDPRGGAKNQEIDFIVGKDFMITARYEVIDSVHNLHKVFEAEELLGLPKNHADAEGLLERVLRHLYAAIGEETEQIARMLERIENDIFSGKERETVFNLSKVSRVLLRFDTTLARHADSLSTFLSELATPEFFGKNFQEHIAHIEAERLHAGALVASYRAVTNELRNTNDSLLSTKQNDIITRLTIMAFATFPLTVITGLFGINAAGVPLVHSPNAFWYIVGIMALSVVLFISFFRFKKWL
ncbi:MAG: Magnesium transporter [Parcubacteria group bacterium]|nr:Magnesium transporter [Parcubacteria group bacterium]